MASETVWWHEPYRCHCRFHWQVHYRKRYCYCGWYRCRYRCCYRRGFLSSLKSRPNDRNIFQHCCDMLCWNVAIAWPGLANAGPTMLRYVGWYVAIVWLGLKVIPQYCIAHPYCARFCIISARKWARARAKRKKFPTRKAWQWNKS